MKLRNVNRVHKKCKHVCVPISIPHYSNTGKLGCTKKLCVVRIYNKNDSIHKSKAQEINDQMNIDNIE